MKMQMQKKKQFRKRWFVAMVWQQLQQGKMDEIVDIAN